MLRFQDHISNLHKDPNFHKTMKDPVKCLFDELELQSMLTEKLEESEKPEKKVCIIFHGAPFTGIYHYLRNLAAKLSNATA